MNAALAWLFIFVAIVIVAAVPIYYIHSPPMQMWFQWCAAVPLLPQATGVIVALILIAICECFGIIDSL